MIQHFMKISADITHCRGSREKNPICTMLQINYIFPSYVPQLHVHSYLPNLGKCMVCREVGIRFVERCIISSLHFTYIFFLPEFVF